ncbi:NlpC/P60 family protein [[Eubacterium] siraeum]|nr:NlpC/P60 family protein [[Eubacterium] siraeum]
MKKKLSLILAMFTVLALASLTACSGNNSPSYESGNDPQNSTQSSVAESSDSSSDNTSSEDNSSDDTSSEDNSSDNTSSEDNSSDNTSSEDNSSDNTSSEDNSSDDTSSEDNSSNDTSSDSGEPVAPSEKGDGIAKAAYDMLGKPFTEGGYQAETGFDNSGLIYYALTSNGIDCPRGLTAQKDMGKEVTLDALQKGDIVFIKDGDSFFGGVYTGDDTLVFSPYPGQKVRTANLKSVYYIDNFLKAVRVG